MKITAIDQPKIIIEQLNNPYMRFPFWDDLEVCYWGIEGAQLIDKKEGHHAAINGNEVTFPVNSSWVLNRDNITYWDINALPEVDYDNGFVWYLTDFEGVYLFDKALDATREVLFFTTDPFLIILVYKTAKTVEEQYRINEYLNELMILMDGNDLVLENGVLLLTK